MGVDGEPDRTVLADGLLRDGRRDTDHHLGRGVVALARPGRIQVEEDPRVGGLLEVELLDLDLPGLAVVRQWIRFMESPGA